MARVIFPSIKNPESKAYVLNPDFEYFIDHRSMGVDNHFRWFPTLGDGMTQHGPECPVAVDSLADYIYSLMKHLNEHPEALPEFLHAFYAPIEEYQVRFLSTVKPTEQKPTRYYSLDQKKTSSSHEKKHDDRWREIPEYFKAGSVEGMMRLYRRAQDFRTTLQYMWAFVAMDRWLQRTGEAGVHASDFGAEFGMMDRDDYNPEKAMFVAEVFNAMKLFVRSYDAYLVLAGAEWTGYERNCKWAKEREAAEAAKTQGA